LWRTNKVYRIDPELEEAILRHISAHSLATGPATAGLLFSIFINCCSIIFEINAYVFFDRQ
jgi:hypothetical protein